jgi:PAS domain S-box-containing protein
MDRQPGESLTDKVETSRDKLESAAHRLRVIELCGLFYIENCSSGVLIVERGIIVYANKRIQAISGYHHSELESQPVEILVPSASRDTHKSHVAGYGRDPRPRPMAGFKLQRKDDTLIPVAIELVTDTEIEGAFTIVTLRVTE